MEAIQKIIRADWPLLLPVVVGFVAVYLLLPRVRRDWQIPGAIAGAAALVLAGWLLIHREFAAVEAVLFYTFSGIAIIGAGLMLAQHNPVRAALSFALVVLSTCGLFLLLAAPFLMAATIIIYAGAIIITFLFVIMLAQQIGMTSADRRSREPFLASLAGFVLLAALLVVLHRNYDASKLNEIDEKLIPVMETLKRAASASTLKDMRTILDPKMKDEDTHPLELVDELKVLLPNEPDLAELEDAIHGPMEDLKKLCDKLIGSLEEKYKKYQQERHGVGSLQPSKNLKLSPFSGVPANEPFPTTARELLPARNVEALGKSLYTDYLVAVEIAGLLLLTATIGAIVIAGRRGDGKRGEVLR